MIGDIVKEMRRQLTGESKALLGLPTGTGGWVGWGPSAKTDFQTLSKEGYEKNALINACINELASSASEAKLVVEQKRGKEWEPVPEHGLQLLLDDPNPLMSAYEFWFNTIMYLSIAGKCFWEMEPSGAGRIVGLWLMRPDLVEIEAMRVKLGERTRKKIAGFRWLGADGQIVFPPEQVLYFKHPHPRDELEGFPPLAAAARDGDTDNFATDFVQSFFKNAAVPFGIFKMKGYQDEAMLSQAKAKLKAMYGGPSQMWHDPLFLGEESEWVPMGSTFTDMDFPQLRRITETRICAVFQVPPILIGAFVGLEKGGLGTPAYTMARKSFWSETLLPAYKKHAGIINRQLAPHFGKDVRVVWDFSEVEALQEEKTAAWTRAQGAFEASMITRNMALEEIGKDPVEGGDIFLVPMMKLPVPIGEKPPSPGAKAYLNTKSAQVPEEWKELWAKAIDMVATSWEGIFGKTAAALFRKEKEALLKILRKEGKATKQGDPFEKFLEEGSTYLLVDKEAWAEEFDPLFAGVMEAQADNILVAYGISFDINRPEVQEFLKGYTFEFAKGIQGVSEKGLRELVATAQSEGWSVPTLRKAIEEDTKHYYDKVRSTRIARTETIRSSNAGTEEAWKQAGIEYKQWYATLDGRQCPECEAEYEYSKDNPTVMGGNFRCGLDFPPLHPNCRCTILAYFEGL